LAGLVRELALRVGAATDAPPDQEGGPVEAQDGDTLFFVPSLDLDDIIARILLSGDDILDGSEANDTIDGFGGDDQISLGGADVLRGGSGEDTLSGGPGADALFGGADRDLLDGGAGDDVVSGGGNIGLVFVRVGTRLGDTFVFSAGAGDDTFLDFEPGIDAVRLQGFVVFTIEPVDPSDPLGPTLDVARPLTFDDLDTGGVGGVLDDADANVSVDAIGNTVLDLTPFVGFAGGTGGRLTLLLLPPTTPLDAGDVIFAA
jgi:Ca2+-binding RTX toxin-like protein